MSQETSLAARSESLHTAGAGNAAGACYEAMCIVPRSPGSVSNATPGVRYPLPTVEVVDADAGEDEDDEIPSEFYNTDILPDDDDDLYIPIIPPIISMTPSFALPLASIPPQLDVQSPVQQSPPELDYIMPETESSSAKEQDSRFYLITNGRRTGVFRGWHRCGPLVLGYRRAVFQRYDTFELAEQAWQNHLRSVEEAELRAAERARHDAAVDVHLMQFMQGLDIANPPAVSGGTPVTAVHGGASVVSSGPHTTGTTLPSLQRPSPSIHISNRPSQTLGYPQSTSHRESSPSAHSTGTFGRRSRIGTSSAVGQGQRHRIATPSFITSSVGTSTTHTAASPCATCVAKQYGPITISIVVAGPSSPSGPPGLDMNIEETRASGGRVYTHSSVSRHRYWYAVAKGTHRGIVESWNDVEHLIGGHCNPRHRRFRSLAEAQAWLDRH